MNLHNRAIWYSLVTIAVCWLLTAAAETWIFQPAPFYRHLFFQGSLESTCYRLILIAVTVTAVWGFTTVSARRRRTTQALEESEARYRVLVEALRDGIATHDKEMNLVYANQRFCEILGRDRAEIDGHSTLEFLDPANQQVLKHQNQRRLAGDLGSYELVWQRGDGGEITTLISPAPMTDLGGNLLSSAIISDITEEKAVLEVLRDSEEFSRSVIENSPLGITIRTPTGQLLNYNAAWQELWQLSDEEIHADLTAVQPELVLDHWDSDYLQPYHAQIQQLFENGGSLYLPDLKTGNNDPGRAWWVSHYFYAIRDIEGNVDRVVIMTEDITPRMLAEEAMRDSEAFSRAVIDGSPISISVRTATGRLLDYNAAWKKLWAIPDEDIQRDMSTPRDRLNFNLRDEYFIEHQDDVRRVYEQGGSLYLPEIKSLGRRPGAAKWVSHHFYAVPDSAGNVDRVVIMTEDITVRKRSEEEREQLISDLQQALADIKTLRGLLPICSHCKKIRDDQGYWNRIEAYISQHADVSFSHGICPECAAKYYPEVKLYNDDGSNNGVRQDEKPRV